MATLGALVDYPDDLREDFAERLAKHYEKNIRGTAMRYSKERGLYVAEELTPPLKKPGDMMKLLKDTVVWIGVPSPRTKAINFKLSFECKWDIEHGRVVHFKNWKIAEFKGSAE
jgi:hypothetical protein